MEIQTKRDKPMLDVPNTQKPISLFNLETNKRDEKGDMHDHFY